MEKDNKAKKQEEETSIIIIRGENSYLNLCCFELNIGLAFTYLYVISSSAINIINRIVFHNYEFNFNFTYSFLQLFLLFKNRETIKKKYWRIKFF